MGGHQWVTSKSDSFARSISKYSTKYSQSDDVVWLGVFGGVFRITPYKRIAFWKASGG